ncbi:MAG: PQQ-binding-like beta-propeller repeat protein, partial [Planctomycetota bacterium]
MQHFLPAIALGSLFLFVSFGFTGEPNLWNQWRGPNRDGFHLGNSFPSSLAKESLQLSWKANLGPSYSGPVVSDQYVFTTETKNKESEVVHAYDRKTGKEIWATEWKGAMSVPFFAGSNGSWIRATPAFDGECLYVAGIKDVLVCLNAMDGKEKWRIDFVEQFKTPVPSFGFVSSPLIDGDAIYVQAGASVFKLNKKNGTVIWRSFKDSGGMNGSAFASPLMTTLCGQKQILIQSREKLAGLNPENGDVLWSKLVTNFRG